MQQFVVPQFIDVEDKIFGPITTRQFLILMASGMIIFLSYRFGDTGLFIFTAVIVGSLAAAFAFLKVKGQNFHIFVLNVLITIRRPSLRVWRKHYSKADLEYLRKRTFEEVIEDAPASVQPKRERIRDLSLIVNTGGYYRGEDGN